MVQVLQLECRLFADLFSVQSGALTDGEGVRGGGEQKGGWGSRGGGGESKVSAVRAVGGVGGVGGGGQQGNRANMAGLVRLSWQSFASLAEALCEPLMVTLRRTIHLEPECIFSVWRDSHMYIEKYHASPSHCLAATTLTP
jgi:hypothetical protein